MGSGNLTKKGGFMKIKEWKEIDWRMCLSLTADTNYNGTVYCDGFRSGTYNIEGWTAVSVPLKMKENMVLMGRLSDPWNHILIK